ncbi:MAG: ABC transporter permease [Acidimicrobiaceae bacterium]|nr:ABC transporter permease [Acidimicrobiaceae bacterium]
MRFIRLSLAQALYNLRAYLRSARTVVLGVVMPVGLLVILSWVFAHQGQIAVAAGYQMSAIAFYAGGLTAYGLMLGTFTGVMVAVVGAREAGWLKRFRAAPVPPGSYLAGQILFNVLISLGLVVVMMTIATLVYDLHLRAAALSAIFAYTLLGVFCFTAVALAITRLITTPEMGSSVGPFVAITLSFTSGVFLPPDLMPHWLVDVSNYLPLEPLAQSMQSVLASSAGTGYQYRTFVVLGVWGVVSFVVARLSFKWQPLRR